MTNELIKQSARDLAPRETFDLSPRNLKEAMELAEIMAKSELIPPQFRGKPADVVVAVQFGSELGLKPLAALQGMYVINGRPCVYGETALAIVMRSGLVENLKEMSFSEIEAAGKAVCWAKRTGMAEPIVREFSVEDAKRANLWSKKNRDGSPGIWQLYPYRMLQMRARWMVLKDGFPEPLKGITSREEMEDIVESAPAPETLAMPKRISEKQLDKTIDDLIAGPEQFPIPNPAATSEAVGASIVTVETPSCESCGSPMVYCDPGITKGGRKYEAYWKCPQYVRGGQHSAIKDAEWKAKSVIEGGTDGTSQGTQGMVG